MDHYAADAAAVVQHLDLRNAVHIGHSTGGGEATRYVARHGEPNGRVIPARSRFDLHDPGVGAERGDAAGLGEETVPSLARGISDGVVVVE